MEINTGYLIYQTFKLIAGVISPLLLIIRIIAPIIVIYAVFKYLEEKRK